MSAALQKNQDTLKNIRKSVSAFSSGLRAASKSSLGISKSLRVGNREKQKSISLRLISFRKRRQAVQRREQEDLIEASNLKNLEKSPNVTKSIASSTRGFLGRIFDTVGKILITWTVLNLPRIIKAVEGLKERVQNTIQGLTNWFNQTFSFFNIFNNEVETQKQNLNVNDTTTERLSIERDSKTITTFLDDVGKSLQEGMKLLQKWSRKETWDQFFSETSSQPTAQGQQNQGQNTGGPTEELKNLIRSAESSGDYTTPYKGNLVIYDANGRVKAEFSRKDEDLSTMTITQLDQFQTDYLNFQKAQGIPDDQRSAAAGAYQILNVKDLVQKYGKDYGLDMDSVFNKKTQDILIEIFLEKEKGLTRQLAAQNPTEFSKGLAQAFAGVPVLQTMQGRSQQVTRGQSYYTGFGKNAATIGADRTEEVIKNYGNLGGQGGPNSPLQINRPNQTGNQFPLVKPKKKQTGPLSSNRQRTIPIPIPQSNQPPPQQVASSSGSSSQMPTGSGLNSSIALAKKLLLTELEYT
jgi:hypothetical protein